MTPEVTDSIPGSLEDTDKFIEVADGHHVTAKQKGSVRIQMFDDNRAELDNMNFCLTKYHQNELSIFLF